MTLSKLWSSPEEHLASPSEKVLYPPWVIPREMGGGVTGVEGEDGKVVDKTGCGEEVYYCERRKAQDGLKEKGKNETHSLLWCRETKIKMGKRSL